MRARFASLVLLACIAPAQATTWSLHVDGGGPIARAPGDELDAATMQRWTREALATRKRLGLAAQAGPVLLQHPLQIGPGLAAATRIGISNFVDHDPEGDRVRDYACGIRSYDLGPGRGHAGIDYFLWPFAWQSMAQEPVAVVAAAAGTILQRVDGQSDRNCAIDLATVPNAVWVQHDDASVAIYLHFKRGTLTDKRIGDRVEAGEYLGAIGSSGASTGPHLHFELRSDLTRDGVRVDPNHGQCHAGATRWLQPPEYREPRLELVGVHDAPPVFHFDRCADNEEPNFRQHFRAGETLIVAGYYADQLPGQASTVVLRGPDGRELSRFEHTPSAADFAGADGFDASYWYFGSTIPADAAPGIYRAEIGYQGVTRTRDFTVGGPIHRASGVWYDPAQSGQGFTVEVVELGRRPHLAVVWFAYLDGEPRWMSGVGEITGDHAVVPVQISRGGRFPPAFAPAEVAFEDWGELRFRFDDDGRGQVEWSTGHPGFGDGTMPLTRLAGIADINLDDEGRGLRACASGSWYVPSQSGHGVQLQVIDAGGERRLLATWYVYHEARQFWLSGVGTISGGRAVVAMDRTRGGDFPPDFDPALIVREPWGTVTFDFIDALRMQMHWQSVQPGFESGTLALSRLTQLTDAPCL